MLCKKLNKNMCMNCGNTSHMFNNCPEPITSWGIILVSCSEKITSSTNIHNDSICNDILNDTYEDTTPLTENKICLSKNICNELKFLMVSRKYSLGYVQFIRGLYEPTNSMHVLYIFRLMMQKEIDNIKLSITYGDNGFDYLWNTFWGKKSDSIKLCKTKHISKTKYDILRNIGTERKELDLQCITTYIEPDYNMDEWGFPKGRKGKYETEIECAVREFEEETGYSRNDIKLINCIKPIVENVIGTDGIKYKHIYYVAELVKNKIIENNVNEEIGKVSFMNVSDALQNIRHYHVIKKEIVEKLFNYYMNRLTFFLL
jgi:8-oxo-dGTP pyrophosphatase MutT (NUDIX family)